MKAIILDTETTGKNTFLDQPIEIAYLEISNDPSTPLVDTGIDRIKTPDANPFYGVIGTFGHHYQPTVPISFGAMATHHILDEDLEGLPSPTTFEFPLGVDYMIGHNVDFDWAILGKPNSDVKLIDTLSLSRVLWPDNDSHTQSACLYRIDRHLARQMTAGAHDAKIDILICLNILDYICFRMEIKSFEQLHALSERARVPTVIGFGKHAGKNIVDEVPQDYKDWYLRQENIDQYVARAMKGERGLTMDNILNETAPEEQTQAPARPILEQTSLTF